MSETFIYTGKQLIWELHQDYLMYADDDISWTDWIDDYEIEPDKLYVVNSQLEILRDVQIEDLTFKDILVAFQNAEPYWRNEWLKELREKFGNREVE